MITYCGKKLTANQVAKAIGEGRGITGLEYMFDDTSLDWDTEREYRALEAAGVKQQDRIEAFFGFDWRTLPDTERKRPAKKWGE